jgi:hypothetical protein
MESRSTVERNKFGIGLKETSIKFHAEMHSSFAKGNKNYENSRRNCSKIIENAIKIVLVVNYLTQMTKAKCTRVAELR